MQSVMERELTVVRLERRSRVHTCICRRAAAARCCELRSQGVGRDLKGPVGWSGEFRYRHLLLDLIEKWLAKIFGTNFNGQRVYKSDWHLANCRFFSVLLQDLMPSYGYSQTWFRIMGKSGI